MTTETKRRKLFVPPPRFKNMNDFPISVCLEGGRHETVGPGGVKIGVKYKQNVGARLLTQHPWTDDEVRANIKAGTDGFQVPDDVELPAAWDPDRPLAASSPAPRGASSVAAAPRDAKGTLAGKDEESWVREFMTGKEPDLVAKYSESQLRKIGKFLKIEVIGTPADMVTQLMQGVAGRQTLR